jgi:hypothetical protein
MMRASGLLAMCIVALGTAAHAQVTVRDAWVRGTVPAQKSTGAFMTLTSGEDARVVAIASPIARQAEIHESSMHGGVMHMHGVEALELPAGKAVELKPGGFHVMLMGLKGPVREGDTVPLTLTIEGRDRKRTTLEVKAAVRPLGSR